MKKIGMKRILKYELEITDDQIIKLKSTTILSVCEQNNKIVVYAIEDTECLAREYQFKVIGTGAPIDYSMVAFSFLGTVKMHNGQLMFHVFYDRIS